MTILEEVLNMRVQGMSDSQVYENLKDRGASPKDINNALNQAQIKQVISGEQPQNYMDPTQYPDAPMQEQPQYADSQQVAQYPQQQGYATTDNTVEIAEQVFDEKISKFQRETTTLQEFKAIAEVKIENIDNRLKRIEEILNMLQSAVLEKVGSYGNTLESIRKEMSMMQDSFSKTLPSLRKKN